MTDTEQSIRSMVYSIALGFGGIFAGGFLIQVNETAGVLLLLAGLEYLLYLRLAQKRWLVFFLLGGIDLVLCPVAYCLALPHVGAGLGAAAVVLIGVAVLLWCRRART